MVGMRFQIPRSRLFSGLLAVAVVSFFFHENGSASTSPSPALFDFHSGFWVNLDLALYQRAQPGATGDIIADNDPDWKQALSFYRENIASRDLLFDDAMVSVKNTLEDQEHAQTLQSTKDLTPVWIGCLHGAARYYRISLWPKQDQANKRWIEQVRPLLDRYGDQLTKSLSSAYQSPWPKESIRVDVANYASWAGAYTTNGPTRITVSSVDQANQGDAALEVLFHEASHGISGKLERAITAECKQQNVLLPRRDLWHAVLFYTTGEIVRRALPNYVPYASANGLWKRAWPMYLDPLEQDWRPYLDGKISFSSAVSAIVKDVGKPK